MVLVVHLLLPLLSGGRSNHRQESQRQAVAGNESSWRAAFDDWQQKRQATRALTIHDSVRLQKQG